MSQNNTHRSGGELATIERGGLPMYLVLPPDRYEPQRPLRVTGNGHAPYVHMPWIQHTVQVYLHRKNTEVSGGRSQSARATTVTLLDRVRCAQAARGRSTRAVEATRRHLASCTPVYGHASARECQSRNRRHSPSLSPSGRGSASSSWRSNSKRALHCGRGMPRSLDGNGVTRRCTATSSYASLALSPRECIR